MSIEFERKGALAWGAFRHGRFMFESDRGSAEEVELYIKAMFADEIKAGMHDASEVLQDHGIEIGRIKIEPV